MRLLLSKKQRRQLQLLEILIKEKRWFHLKELAKRLDCTERSLKDVYKRQDQYVETLKAAIFNLGYLPSADKSVITLPATTIEAMEKICARLEKGGRMAIMIYYGHELSLIHI